MKDSAGTPGDANIPRLQHFERHERGVCQVPQLMGEKAEALVAARGLAVMPD